MDGARWAEVQTRHGQDGGKKGSLFLLYLDAVSEQIGFALTLSTDPALKPEIQNVMEVDIGKERREN